MIGLFNMVLLGNGSGSCFIMRVLFGVGSWVLNMKHSETLTEEKRVGMGMGLG